MTKEGRQTGVKTEAKHRCHTGGREAGARLAEASRISQRGSGIRHRRVSVGGVLPHVCLDPSTSASSDNPLENWAEMPKEVNLSSKVGMN